MRGIGSSGLLAAHALSSRGSGLLLPESVLHVALDHDGKGSPLSLPRRGISDGRAVFLGLLDRQLDVFDREIGPYDRLLMRGQRLADAHEGSVRLSRDAGLPEIGVWGPKGETVHALVEPRKG